VLQFPVLVPPMIFLIGALSVVSAADYTLALNRVRVAARRGGPRT